MIDARTHAYAERVPRADALLATDAPDAVARAACRRRIANCRASRPETTWWRSQLRTSASNGRVSSACRRSSRRCRRVWSATALPDKLRLIRGVLYWRLEAASKDAGYQAEHSLRDVDTGARGAAEPLGARVQQARASVAEHQRRFCRARRGSRSSHRSPARGSGERRAAAGRIPGRPGRGGARCAADTSGVLFTAGELRAGQSVRSRGQCGHEGCDAGHTAPPAGAGAQP